jgi:hypothetical protein
MSCGNHARDALPEGVAQDDRRSAASSLNPGGGLCSEVASGGAHLLS